MSRVKKSRGSKFLALVVALTFLLSMAAPAFAAAPADLQQTEANRLQTLGIIAGFPDGTLGLDQTITRAQFAKVIAIATGNEIIADAMVNSPTKFSDAKVGVWYTGYVNVASELGYILGYPDGTFKPNQAITNAEVLTILLRALGYDDRLPGSWPTDYLAKANELGISDDVTFAAKAAALRGDAFIFTSRTLDTNMVTWDSDANEFVERDPAITLLAKALKGTTEEGYLANLNWDNNTLKAFIAYYDEKDELKTKEYKVVSKPVIVGADSVLDLLAQKVSYVLNSDDQIIYLSAQDNDVVTDTEITFYNDDTAQIDDEYYDVADGAMLNAFPTNLAAIAENDGTYTADKVTAVLDGGDIIFVLFEEYENPGIVESVDDNYINVVSGSSGNVDLEDEDYAVIKDGVLASLNDLEAGDLVYVIKDAHDLDYLIVAESSNNAISGTLEDINADYTKITVDGVEYDVDSDAIASSDDGKNYEPFTGSFADDFAGQDVNILLSPAGLVAAVTSDFDAEPGLYGILLDVTTAGFDHKVRILTAAGDKATFDLDEDEVVADVVYDDDKKVFDADQPGGEPLAVLYDLIKYGLNSKGEIDSITAITKDATVKDADKDNNRIKLDDSWYRVTDTTAFFGLGPDGPDDWTTTTWSNFADVGEVPVNFDYDGNTVTAIVYNGPVTTEGDYGVILKAGRNVDGPYYRLMVLGEEVTYNLANASDFNATVVSEVYEFTLNADNEITLGDVAEPKVDKKKVEAFSAGNYIKVDGAYYDFDDETSIVDVTGDAPEVKTSVGTGETVNVYVDGDGYVDYIVIVSSGTTPSPTPTVTTYVYNGMYQLDQNWYVQLGDTTYPYVGPTPPSLTVGDTVEATFATIRDEVVVTKLELYTP